MMTFATYEQRLDAVTTAAWETWTKNGLGLDDDEREQTGKSVRDAAANEYVDDISDKDWLDRTLARVGYVH
jgi:hypothetical protein